MTEQNQAQETTGARLARLRRAQNITQEALAERLEVSRQAVSKWESDLAYPETDKLLKLARLYGCTVDYLLTGVTPSVIPGGTPGGAPGGTPGETPKTEPTAAQPHPQSATPDLWTRLGEAWNCRPRYFEYKSRRTVGSLPLVHINIGLGRKAKGVIAIGLSAKGVVSLGLASAGILSVGLCSVGLLSLGLLSLGLLFAVGSIAVGAVAIGAIAVGLLAIGALSAGLISVGALAMGHFVAVGDHAYGMIAVGQTVAEGDLYESIGFFRLTEAEMTVVEDILREHCPAVLRDVGRWILRWMCS